MCGIDESFMVELDGGRRARAVRVEAIDELARAVRELEVGGRAALVVVGGASGMSPRETRRLGPLFRDVLAPLAQQLGATVIDGGTDTGVMRLMAPLGVANSGSRGSDATRSRTRDAPDLAGLSANSDGQRSGLWGA
jgi:hypothetical protein